MPERSSHSGDTHDPKRGQFLGVSFGLVYGMIKLEAIWIFAYAATSNCSQFSQFLSELCDHSIPIHCQCVKKLCAHFNSNWKTPVGWFLFFISLHTHSRTQFDSFSIDRSVAEWWRPKWFDKWIFDRSSSPWITTIWFVCRSIWYMSTNSSKSNIVSECAIFCKKAKCTLDMTSYGRSKPNSRESPTTAQVI